jgi:hypothetical protein
MELEPEIRKVVLGYGAWDDIDILSNILWMLLDSP